MRQETLRAHLELEKCLPVLLDDIIKTAPSLEKQDQFAKANHQSSTAEAEIASAEDWWDEVRDLLSQSVDGLPYSGTF